MKSFKWNEISFKFYLIGPGNRRINVYKAQWERWIARVVENQMRKDQMETVADAGNDRGLKAVACECRGMSKSIGKKYLVIN